MSSFGSGAALSNGTPYSSGADNVGNNSYGFTTGGGSGGIDTTGLSGALSGVGAGTSDNSFGTGAGSMPTSGSLNGNLSFSMPNTSGNFDSSKFANGMAAGAKLTGGSAQDFMPAHAGTVHLSSQNFSAPVVDFAGSNKGSQAGQSLLKLLANYHPGSKP